MSSERRHQLEHNELAVWLAKVNKAIEPYSKLIAVGNPLGCPDGCEVGAPEGCIDGRFEGCTLG